MVLGVFRLIIVASIFAFVLTVRTVAPIHAASGDPADPTPVLGEDPPIDLPPPTEPPPVEAEPPPVEAEPPPADTVEPAPTDPPPADSTEPVEPPAEPPVEEEPPPADTVEPAPTEPPPDDTVTAEPPTEPPVEEEPPPADAVEPAPTDPPPADTTEAVEPPPDPLVEELPPVDAIEPVPTDPPVSDEIVPPLTDPSAVIDDPAVSDRSATRSAPSAPSTKRSAAPVPPVAENPAALVTVPAKSTPIDESPERIHAFAPAIAGAGLAAGLAITNHAPSSVAVAVEFGRAGGGWAGALVFNLWLRRQMRERRMSQRRLADLAGVDHSTISRLLRQDRRPSLTTATKLASALKQVPGEGAEPAAVDYFERIPEETVFPARRVELALRADEMLNDDQVRRLMNIYLEARRRNQASAPAGSARSRAAPARAAPDAS